MNKIKPWKPGIPDRLSLKCASCGKVPEIDYVINDKAWRELVPKNYWRDVICLNCLIRLGDNNINLLNDLIHIYMVLDDYTLELTVKDIYKGPWLKGIDNE